MLPITLDLLFTLTRSTHYFTATKISPRGNQLLLQFMPRFVQKAYRPGRNTRYVPPDGKESKEHVFALRSSDFYEYRFHIGQLVLFLTFLRDQGIGPDFYEIIDAPMHTAVPMSVQMKATWEPRDRQGEVIDFLLRDMADDQNSRLVTLPPGYGKGLISLFAVTKRGWRTAYIILPGYIDKTITEILQKTDASLKRIIKVQGSDALRGLIDMAKTGRFDHDFVVISMKTWMLFLNAYLFNEHRCTTEEYGCSPQDLFPLLGIGTAVIDEIHQHLHAVYRTFCFMQVDRAIGLSATFLSADAFVDRMQRIMFPREIRFENVDIEKHVRAYGIMYNISFDSLRRIKTSERGSTDYSQNAFEASILKHKAMLEKYFELVGEVVANGFMDDYAKGRKCIIFCRRVDMCEQIVKFLQSKYPTLDIRKFTEADPEENLYKPDIRVTTQMSAGTGVDIEGLVTNITLDNIGSPVPNLQCIGRLRKPKDGVARYYAVYCPNIPKHRAYAERRRALFADRVLSYKEFVSNVGL